MYDVDAVWRFWVAFADVEVEVVVCCALAFTFVAHGEESAFFIDYDDVSVLIENGHAFWGVFFWRSFEFLTVVWHDGGGWCLLVMEIGVSGNETYLYIVWR